MDRGLMLYDAAIQLAALAFFMFLPLLLLFPALVVIYKAITRRENRQARQTR